VERHLGQTGSPGYYGEIKQRRAGIGEHWDGEFGLAEQKRNGQVPCVVLTIIVRNLCVYEWHCDSPAWSWVLKGSLFHFCSLPMIHVFHAFPSVLFPFSGWPLKAGPGRISLRFDRSRASHAPLDVYLFSIPSR
jgi:hypothetical protein